MPPSLVSFPWEGALARLGFLRLTPDQFWRMSPRELAAASKGLAGQIGRPEPLDRAGLDALMRAFPDLDPKSN